VTLRTTLALLGAGVVATAHLATPRALSGQDAHRDPVYGNIAPPVDGTAPAVAPAEDPTVASQRRARVAARAGEVTVTVGEIEDYLAGAPRPVQDTFRSPAGRRGVVERLLRQHLLALEAERRGSIDEATRQRARRREDRVLRDLLEDEVRRDPGAIPPPDPPVQIPEERFGVILRTDSRQVAEAWAREAATLPFTQALARANEVGQGQETPYGRREAAPEAQPPIEDAVWRAVYSLEAIGRTSRPISIGGGRFAVVFLGGTTGGYTQEGPDERARRMLAAERALVELITQVRADRVTSFDPSTIDGVAFRMGSDRSPEAMRQLAREVEAVRAAQAAQAPDDEEASP
jgi:hypothetical protein